MAVLIISGSGRGVGKTAVGCALIAALPEFRWIAVKVSPHSHDLPDAIWEETDRNSDKDTGRYLAAGALRAFLIGAARDTEAVERVTKCRSLSAECDAVLVETNRVPADSLACSGEGVCCVAVVKGPQTAWKPSLWNCMAEVEGLVLSDGEPLNASLGQFRQKTVFRVEAGRWSTPEMVQYVFQRLRLEKD